MTRYTCYRRMRLRDHMRTRQWRITFTILGIAYLAIRLTGPWT